MEIIKKGWNLAGKIWTSFNPYSTGNGHYFQIY